MYKRTYSELMQLPTYEERLKYLDCCGIVGEETFGYERYLNQRLYSSPEWRQLRHKIILRDSGIDYPCDLGVEGYEIVGPVYIHHINPITKEQLADMDPEIFNPENLVCCSRTTHEIIHYGYRHASKELELSGDRTPNDTTPWK